MIKLQRWLNILSLAKISAFYVLTIKTSNVSEGCKIALKNIEIVLFESEMIHFHFEMIQKFVFCVYFCCATFQCWCLTFSFC